MTRFTNGGQFGLRLTGSFRHQEAVSHTHIQDRNAELFTHIPMVVKPNWPSVRDPNRQVYDCRGTFSWESALQRLGMRETEVVTRRPKLEFKRCDLLVQPQRGDVFRRQCDMSDFEVVSVEKDGMSGVCVNLVQLGVPS